MEKEEANTEVLLYMYCEVYTIHYFSRGRHWLSGQRSNFKNKRHVISFRRATNIVVLHKMGVKYIVYSQHTHWRDIIFRLTAHNTQGVTVHVV